MYFQKGVRLYYNRSLKLCSKSYADLIASEQKFINMDILRIYVLSGGKFYGLIETFGYSTSKSMLLK